MIKKIGLAILSLCFVSVNTQAQKMKKLPSGLEYVMYKDTPGAKFIKDGSYVKMHIRTKIADSAMFDSYVMNKEKPIEQQLTAQFLGAFMEGFSLLSEGDSAMLRLPYEKAFKDQPLPPFAKAGDPVSYQIKVFTIKTKEEFEKSKADAAAVQNKIDDKLIRAYIQKNKLKTLRTTSGIFYSIEKKGNGVHPVATDKVKVHYKGTTLAGETFDSSYDRGEPVEFPLANVIKGWTEGIPLLDEGGKGKLIIPSSLAYGENAPPGSTIKENEVLVFDVELLNIVKEESKPEMQEEPKVDVAAQNALDATLIKDYIIANKLVAKSTASGLHYVIEKTGNGKHATTASTVKVHYLGTVLDGTKFDSSYDRGQPIEFPLANVIKGWQEGIPLIEEGGKGKLIIPSSIAYGAQSPTPVIKPNSVLVFDVEVLEVK
jgi:FKBP-type peptidyl-prolyl cis-trans isomerase